MLRGTLVAILSLALATNTYAAPVAIPFTGLAADVHVARDAIFPIIEIRVSGDISRPPHASSLGLTYNRKRRRVKHQGKLVDGNEKLIPETRLERLVVGSVMLKLRLSLAKHLEKLVDGSATLSPAKRRGRPEDGSARRRRGRRRGRQVDGSENLAKRQGRQADGNWRRGEPHWIPSPRRIGQAQLVMTLVEQDCCGERVSVSVERMRSLLRQERRKGSPRTIGATVATGPESRNVLSFP